MSGRGGGHKIGPNTGRRYHATLDAGNTGFKRRQWSEAEEEVLGTNTDRVIATELLRTEPEVKTRREELGIPRFAHEPRRWTLEEERLLGTASDYVIARRRPGP